MPAVNLCQKASSQQFEVLETKNHSSPLSAFGRSDSVDACHPTDLATLCSPASNLVESNMDQEVGNMESFSTEPKQYSHPAHNPGPNSKMIGSQPGPASMPGSRPDQKSGKARRKAKKRKAENEQARKKTNQVLQHPLGVDQQSSTACVHGMQGHNT